MSRTPVTLWLDDAMMERLGALGPDLIETITEVLDHVQQAVYRPGSWERGWLQQAIGDGWLANVETDPGSPAFDRVRHP